MIRTERKRWYYPGFFLFTHQAKVRYRQGVRLYLVLVLFWAAALEAQQTGRASQQSAPHEQSREGLHVQGRGLASRLHHRVARSLWQGRIGVIPETEQQVRDKNELQNLIERINSVNIMTRKADQVAAEADPARQSVGQGKTGIPVQAEIPARDVAPVQPKPEAGADPGEAKRRAGELTPVIKERLAKQPDLPDKVMDPLGIAEILNSMGFLTEAARFYESAQKRIRPEDTANAEKRAWILLQWANCLRPEQPALAIEIYQTLLSEYPDSPWNESAQIWLKLAQWQTAERPLELIQECEQLKVSNNNLLDALDS